MPAESPDRSREVAIEQLEALGLSAYAARTFVALVSLGDGTAKDVSEVSDVPRTRVYDAVEELRDRGLVDVQQSTPKRFWAISTETASRRFEHEYTRRVDVLREALGGVEPISQSEEQRGVWTVVGRTIVSDRVLELGRGDRRNRVHDRQRTPDRGDRRTPPSGERARRVDQRGE